MVDASHHHLYNRAAWRRLRAAQLSGDPLCRMHRAIGQLVAGSVVDHVVPHRGDPALFFDAANLQTLCKPCHDGHKQAQEANADGILRGAGHDGQPLDLAHPWHRAPAVALRAVPPATAAAGPLAATQGAGQNPAASASKTAPVSTFARCRNSQGGPSA